MNRIKILFLCILATTFIPHSAQAIKPKTTSNASTSTNKTKLSRQTTKSKTTSKHISRPADSINYQSSLMSGMRVIEPPMNVYEEQVVNQSEYDTNTVHGYTDDVTVGNTVEKVVLIEKPSPPKPPKSMADDNKVFDTVEQNPVFPGGLAALMQYVASHIKYPAIARENYIQGRVTVQFVVTKTGSVGQVKVVRGKDPELDKEAVRVVKSLPKFTPGMMNGHPVNVWYTLPITFKVSE